MLALIMVPTTQILPQRNQKSAWLNIARVFQVVIICLTIGLFTVSIPINFEQRSIICQAQPCPQEQLAPGSVQALNRISFSVDSFISMTIALDILVAITYTVCAIVIFVRKPNDLLTIFVTIMLVTFGSETFTGAIGGIAFVYPGMEWLVATIALVGNSAILVFLFVFPNGRFIPRWSIMITVVYVLIQLPRYYAPDSQWNLVDLNSILYNLFFIGINLSGLGAQVYRYRKISDLIEKQQTKWVVYGLIVGIGGYMAVKLLGVMVDDPNGSGLVITIGFNVLAVFLMLLLPISISIAVLRYRLWDINPIINRTLVYGALTACTMALYIFSVGFFSTYFQQKQASFIIPFIATGIIAVMFEPLRERLQRGVNRLMYGERDDPAAVLTRLSQRLDSALAPDSVLQTIVETLAQTLRLPYAAITLFYLDEEPRLISHFGLPPSELIHLPLIYQTERVGELILAPRAPGESFSADDMRLINLIGQQAGVSAHTVHLNSALQHSREKLVTAQEEERRRLSRDLHDGVGPTLASLSQRLDAASDLVKSDPEKSIQLLKDLKGQVKGTVAEIRRLVYALRPPVLDEFGLVSAIREHVAPYTGPNGLLITFDVTDPMPPLPAAVEVAAYRIALEAFTNIVHHAEASQCDIKIKLEQDSLLLEVSDNGKGLSSKTHLGVGLNSMRERATELGGECMIENLTTGGTRVQARLPIAKE